MKITKLTKEQESKIPEYIQKWVDSASKPIDRNKALELAKDIFKKENPLILFTESIENTKNLILYILKKNNIKLSQLYSQLYSQLDSQLYSQLDSQLDSQLRSQLYSQLYSQLDSQLRSQLDSQLYSQLGSQKIVYSKYVSFYLYDWAGYYDYGEYIGVKFNNLERYFDILLNMPICIFVGNIVFICEKPVCLWENRLLHSEIKPAIGWQDNTGVYFLKGVKFEKDLWQKIVSKTIPFKEAIKLKNTEQRIIAIQYLGGKRLEKELGGIIKAKDEYGELIELTKLKDTRNRNYLYLKAFDPSENDYVYIRVNPECKTPKEAEAQSYRLQMFNLEYNPASRT